MNLDAPTAPFSVQLRQATWARHESVDPTAGTGETEPGILAALLDGDLHLHDYAAMTAQQYFVYQALEEAAEAMRNDPVAGSFVFDELFRLPALDTDLSLLFGPGWLEEIRATRATQRYVDRLREVCFDWPGGFVAHHYTRYLGDLSGGQAFRSAASHSYGFGDGPGVSFYVFDQITDLSRFKDGYRAKLDAAGWDDAEKQRIVTEVLSAYDYNEALLAELSTRMRRSV